MIRQYSAIGSRILASGRVVGVEQAATMEAVHRTNATYWLGREDLSPVARETMAKIDTQLADEMAEAVQQASAPQPQEIAA